MQIRIPDLKATQGSKQLMFLDSAGYMDEVWPKLKAANINTALGCVTWEQIEPVEGKFDFTELDQCVQDARAHGIHLVLLWFGSFKNGRQSLEASTNLRDAEKTHTDKKRFPRAILRKAGGRTQIGDVLSIFNTESQIADARAFAKPMAHLKEVDEEHSTVLMVQVENETDLLGDSRNANVAGKQRFNSPVPVKLLETLQAEWDSLHSELQQNLTFFKAQQQHEITSWPSVFGDSIQTDEIFMAYHYAEYLNTVASAGKAVYPLPLYANVWQNYNSSTADNNFPIVVGGGSDPGDYPSGGGTINVLDIWQLFAPSLDFIAPDVYLNDHAKSCAAYRHRTQPLFIPEQRRDEYDPRRLWTAYGSYQALATSPFGIDTLEVAEKPYGGHYGLLASVAPHVLQAQHDDSSVGFFSDELPITAGAKNPSPPVTATFGPWILKVSRSFVFGHPGPGSGMVIHKGGNSFLLIGCGFQVQFTHTSAPFTGVLRFEEKEAQPSGELKTLRMLNGDQTRSGSFCIMPNAEIDYGGFPIRVTIPARTAIAEDGE